MVPGWLVPGRAISAAEAAASSQSARDMSCTCRCDGRLSGSGGLGAPFDGGQTMTAQQTDFEIKAAAIRQKYLMPRSQRPTSTARGVHHMALICSDVEQT